MAKLPSEFIESTRQLMGAERFERYLQSFEEAAPVSIRLNPMKTADGWEVEDAEKVPWCRDGYYLRQRPNFTFDPLFHAGCYYVQEASSMFLDEILRQHLTSNLKPQTSNLKPQTSNLKPQTALDLCAAPGGKSTLLRSALPEDCVLYSNEPNHRRADILLENVTKWGYNNHIVTNAYPRDYRASGLRFDLILCDVPCSGEGMFRKDEATIREWSPQQVEKCRQLQRDIVNDAWQCLNDGGLFIYSTCTFNTKENEENIRWILETFDDAEVIPIETKPEWHITGSLLDGFHEPVFRFIPGITQGEGMFMCALRKMRNEKLEMRNGNEKWLNERANLKPQSSNLKLQLTYQQAMKFLRGESITLPADTPRGLVDVAFMGKTLGQVKNIGARANNLYPKPWRIKTTHIPNDYETILRHTEPHPDGGHSER